MIRLALVLFAVVLATVNPVHAGAPLPGVPEIDPSSALSALALLTGGSMLITDRFRK